METQTEVKLSDSQEAELRRLKQYFPYRICFAALNPVTGDFMTMTRYSKPTRLWRSLQAKGYSIFVHERTWSGERNA